MCYWFRIDNVLNDVNWIPVAEHIHTSITTKNYSSKMKSPCEEYWERRKLLWYVCLILGEFLTQKTTFKLDPSLLHVHWPT